MLFEDSAIVRSHIFSNNNVNSARKVLDDDIAALGFSKTIKSRAPKSFLLCRKYSLTNRLIRFRSDAFRQDFLLIAKPKRALPTVLIATWPVNLFSLTRTPRRNTALNSDSANNLLSRGNVELESAPLTFCNAGMGVDRLASRLASIGRGLLPVETL